MATAQRLSAAGFHPDFGAPSNLNTGNALLWFDQMITQVPQSLQYLTELSYHRYGGDTPENLQAIGDRTVQHGIDSAMTEKIAAKYLQLHQDLKLGRVSSWQQFTLAYPTDDNGAQYYRVDRSDPANPTVHIGRRSKFLRQYFRFIRSGAQRIGADSNQGELDPVAFINTDGTYVVVVQATAAASLSIEGLPSGTYGIKYTTSGQYDVDLPDVTIGTGQPVQAEIPAVGVITIYGVSEASADPGSLAFASSSYEVAEDGGTATIGVVRTGGS
ncbi:MAG: hypothetical protein GTO62_08580, partial [Planctomycetales bacterium]|nr:hypothetical protein [Planctomycetales bacterium]